MRLAAVFGSRNARLGLLGATVVGSVVAVAGAFADSSAVLGVGMLVVAAVVLVAVKLVLELAVAAASSPVPGLARAVEQQRADAAAHARLVAEVDQRAETLERLLAEADDVASTLRADHDALRADHDAGVRRMDALEARLTPTRRFATTLPSSDVPRELALGEVLGATSIEPPRSV